MNTEEIKRVAAAIIQAHKELPSLKADDIPPLYDEEAELLATYAIAALDKLRDERKQS